MKIEKYFYGVCALCLLLSCQQAAKQVDTPVLPTKPFEMGEVVITKGPFIMRRKRRLLICWNWNRTVFLVDSVQKPD